MMLQRTRMLYLTSKCIVSHNWGWGPQRGPGNGLGPRNIFIAPIQYITTLQSMLIQSDEK